MRRILRTLAIRDGIENMGKSICCAVPMARSATIIVMLAEVWPVFPIDKAA